MPRVGPMDRRGGTTEEVLKKLRGKKLQDRKTRDYILICQTYVVHTCIGEPFCGSRFDHLYVSEIHKLLLVSSYFFI